MAKKEYELVIKTIEDLFSKESYESVDEGHFCRSRVCEPVTLKCVCVWYVCMCVCVCVCVSTADMINIRQGNVCRRTGRGCRRTGGWRCKSSSSRGVIWRYDDGSMFPVSVRGGSDHTTTPWPTKYFRSNGTLALYSH